MSRRYEYNRKRIGTIACLPQSIYYLTQFGSFLFASWYFTVEHAYESALLGTSQNTINPIDLLIFCEGKSCSFLPKQCIEFDGNSSGRPPTCYYFPIATFKAQYPYLNSYCFLSHKDILSLPKYYTYLMRTDMDVFLTPALLKWTPRFKIVTGMGGYSDKFNQKRLVEMAHRYNLRHQRVHNLGSTWFGDASLLLQVSNLSLYLSKRIYETEFDAKRFPEIATFMNHSPKGKWTEWWRPVSTMYGQELALNHLVDNINNSYIGSRMFDIPSCGSINALQQPHIHTWHMLCEFNKFTFLNAVAKKLKQGQYPLVPPAFEGDRMAACLSVRQYCTYIAWNSLVRHSDWANSLRNF
ncbi:unnamed protein product [Soboliphyme baturini]|uniref:Alpha-1,4-N-acetylglucosaminyltransferase n=1 Tax=Soboliphyme baturini TaxID=241478 RepID=A0A183IG68_9BILA|nr:unnamed protein product [Soboliphyme baturini]